jgi:ureidoglycolate dehydrogenase (NAD+)
MEQTTATISISDLESFCQDALKKCGLCEADACVATDVLVTTDAFGVFTHGTKSLKDYVRRIRAGGLKADAVPEICTEGPAWAVIDGHSALAMITSVFAMRTAIEKAKTVGIAYVGVRNSCHFGAAGYYALLAAKADMIGMAMANDIPSMAVPGSRKAVMGTNPFAYAVPAGEEDPIFLDIASSAVAGGKIRIAQSLGQKVPDTWLVDAEGVPTTDPFAYPYNGALQPFAGHKGYGFALMIESLAGALSGAGIRREIGGWIDMDPSLPTGHGAAFLAIDIGQMVPINSFKQRVDAMICDIRQTPKAKGCERICVPGEMEWEKRRKALINGIALPEDALESLRGLAGDVGLNVDWLSKQSNASKCVEGIS